MTSNGSDRLARIEAILESVAQRQEEHDRRIDSNAILIKYKNNLGAD